MATLIAERRRMRIATGSTVDACSDVGTLGKPLTLVRAGAYSADVMNDKANHPPVETPMGNTVSPWFTEAYSYWFATPPALLEGRSGCMG